MIVTVSRTFAPDLAPELDALVRAGFGAVDAGDVEVHVKARATTRRRYVAEVVHKGQRVRAGYARKADAVQVAESYGGTWKVVNQRSPRAGGWSGRTYNGVPGLGRVSPGIRFLVTMNIPADPRRLTRYPADHRYPGLKSAPLIRLESWEESLFVLAAHEARHVHQFRHDLPASEIDAERHALARLEEWRAERRREAGVVNSEQLALGLYSGGLA